MAAETKTEVTYLADVHPDFTLERRPVNLRRGRRPGQGADGYGREIHTDYVVKLSNGYRRVFCCQISNAGSLYVKLDGDWVFLRDADFDERLSE